MQASEGKHFGPYHPADLQVGRTWLASGKLNSTILHRPVIVDHTFWQSSVIAYVHKHAKYGTQLSTQKENIIDLGTSNYSTLK